MTYHESIRRDRVIAMLLVWRAQRQLSLGGFAELDKKSKAAETRDSDKNDCIAAEITTALSMRGLHRSSPPPVGHLSAIRLLDNALSAWRRAPAPEFMGLCGWFTATSRDEWSARISINPWIDAAVWAWQIGLFPLKPLSRTAAARRYAFRAIAFPIPEIFQVDVYSRELYQQDDWYTIKSNSLSSSWLSNVITLSVSNSLA